MLAASVDDEQVSIPCSKLDAVQASAHEQFVPQVETELAEVKSQAKMIFRRLNRNSEQQASIESGQYTLQYTSHSSNLLVELCLIRWPQLHNTRLRLFPLHSRQIVSSQACLYLSL